MAFVSQSRSVASVGFNGFPQKMEDKEEWYSDREEKYKRIIHAEINAKEFLTEKPIGFTLYTYPFSPCSKCMGEMIQAGITKFVFPSASEDALSRWKESFDKAKEIAEECGV